MAKREQSFIRATPNPVPYVDPPATGVTTIAWSTGDAALGAISVQETGGEEQLFADAPGGEKLAAWICPGVDYHFRLYSRSQKGRRPLRELSVRMEAPAVQPAAAPPVQPPAVPFVPPTAQPVPVKPQPFIKATPNPIPDVPGPDLGTTTIEWSTGDGSIGWIYLRTAGKQETLFASGPHGTKLISWIQRNLAYRFTLYADQGRATKLTAVTVTRGSPGRELALDLAVVGGAIIAAATPVVVAAWTVKRVARKILSR